MPRLQVAVQVGIQDKIFRFEVAKFSEFDNLLSPSIITTLALHFGVRSLTVHFNSLGRRYPQNVVTSNEPSHQQFYSYHWSLHEDSSTIPDQNLTQSSSMFPVDIFLCVRELDIHVRVHADKSAFVFGLSPFQADDNLVVDPAKVFVTHSVQTSSFLCVKGDGRVSRTSILRWRTYKFCSKGRGFSGVNCAALDRVFCVLGQNTTHIHNDAELAERLI